MKRSTRKQVLARLSKKISALRATLPNDEREVLDSIMGIEEVSAHRLQTAKLPVKQSAKKDAVKMEANAHRLHTAKLPVKQSAKKEAVKMEVNAHRIAPRKTLKKDARQTFRVGFDQNTEEYRIQE